MSIIDNAATVKVKEINIPAVDNTASRVDLISRIEELAFSVIEQICLNQAPRISYEEPCTNNFPQTKRRKFTFAYSQNRNSFALMMTIMAAAHRLLMKQIRITTRSFYYELKDEKPSLAPKQSMVDESVNCLAKLLKCSPWDLNFVATSKGLVAGDLMFSVAEDTVDCKIPGGALIPQNVSSITFIRVRAKFVLIVEKDAVFQRLLQDNCPSVLNCVLITGKGYPDRATRMLVQILSARTDLPVYIIADADPFGVDIMCVYRFGSCKLADKSLVSSNLRWLGVFPSELVPLGVKTIPLTKLDLVKLASIENRAYVTEAISRELAVMREGKAEIEGVASLSRNFLIATYLSCKIRGNDCI